MNNHESNGIRVDEQEVRKAIKGYEGIYEITVSGRIIIKKSGKARHKKGNVYGYAHVHLHKSGERELYRTFDLWRQVYPELPESEFKGIKDSK